MVYNVSYSNSILETLGVLSSFNIAESIWDKYEHFAIPRIKDATIRIRGSFYYLKDLTPNLAVRELKSLTPLMPILRNLRNIVSFIDQPAFIAFKDTALDFFDTVDSLFANLQDLADVHSSYKLSMPVLATDWDSSEDEHWNDY